MEISNNPPASRTPSRLLSLPLELQILIASYLLYPDALALRHTHPQFYVLVPTNVIQKVYWLISRHERRLKCPDRNCIMKTDSAFCSSGNGEIRRLMEKRRRHGDCKEGQGECEIVVGRTCGGLRRGKGVAMLENSLSVIRGVGTLLMNFWQHTRTERALTLWTILALFMSLIVNVWLIMGMETKVLGLLGMGEVTLWTIG